MKNSKDKNSNVVYWTSKWVPCGEKIVSTPDNKAKKVLLRKLVGEPNKTWRGYKGG